MSLVRWGELQALSRGQQEDRGYRKCKGPWTCKAYRAVLCGPLEVLSLTFREKKAIGETAFFDLGKRNDYSQDIGMVYVVRTVARTWA